MSSPLYYVVSNRTFSAITTKMSVRIDSLDLKRFCFLSFRLNENMQYKSIKLTNAFFILFTAAANLDDACFPVF